MKRMIGFVLVLASLAAGSVWGASTHWASVNISPYGGGDPTLETASYYSAFVCSLTDAMTLYDGASTISDMTTYLKTHCPVESVASLDQLDMREAGLGQYSLTDFFVESFTGDYFCIVTYKNGEDKAFRVYANTAENGNVLFEEESGKVGAWSTCSAVPEPTGGMLMLLGMAALMLRRRCG